MAGVLTEVAQAGPGVSGGSSHTSLSGWGGFGAPWAGISSSTRAARGRAACPTAPVSLSSKWPGMNHRDLQPSLDWDLWVCLKPGQRGVAARQSPTAAD